MILYFEDVFYIFTRVQCLQELSLIPIDIVYNITFFLCVVGIQYLLYNQLITQIQSKLIIESKNMKNLRINGRDDMIRMHKTPSPSNFLQIKSPRLNQAVNRPADSAFRVNEQYRNNEHIDAFRVPNEYSKQQNTNASSVQQAQKLGFSNSSNRPVKTQQNIKKISTPIQNDQNPYNTYFQPSKIQTPTQNNIQFNQNDRKTKASNNNMNSSTNSNNGSNKSLSRRSSINSRDGANQYSDGNRNSYQQTIRKLANENIRLRHQCKVMQQRNQKVTIDRKNICAQVQVYKTQLEKVRKINEDIFKKQANLNEQVKNLNKKLQTNTEQLGKCNYEIYRMKQQIFDLRQIILKQSQKPKQKQKQIPITSSSATTIPSQFNSQKLLPSPGNNNDSTIDSHQGGRSSRCKNCKINYEGMSELVNHNEYLKLQLLQKTNIVTSLFADMQKMENQLKILEKPRNIHKKYLSLISELNDDIMGQKAKDLSYKYMNLTK